MPSFALSPDLPPWIKPSPSPSMDGRAKLPPSSTDRGATAEADVGEQEEDEGAAAPPPLRRRDPRGRCRRHEALAGGLLQLTDGAPLGSGSFLRPSRSKPAAHRPSRSKKTPHLPISAPQFSVGQSKHCSLCLKDQPISKMLCKLRCFEQGGQCELEVIGKKGMVQLNARSISPGTKVPLTGGDEVVVSTCGKHAYIFQHPLNDKVPKMVPSSAVSLLESPVASVKRIRMDKRTGDASPVAGTEMLASTSNQSKDLPATPSTSAEGNNQRVLRPMRSSASDKIAKIATYKIRPVLRMIAGSTISEFDLTGDLFKALEDQYLKYSNDEPILHITEIIL